MFRCSTRLRPSRRRRPHRLPPRCRSAHSRPFRRSAPLPPLSGCPGDRPSRPTGHRSGAAALRGRGRRSPRRTPARALRTCSAARPRARHARCTAAPPGGRAGSRRGRTGRRGAGRAGRRRARGARRRGDDGRGTRRGAAPPVRNADNAARTHDTRSRRPRDSQEARPTLKHGAYAVAYQT